MKFDDFFPYQVCINLDSRPDRWQRMVSRFAEHGMNRFVRVSAVDGRTVEIPQDWRYSPGAYGCLQSHLAVVEQARNAAKPSVLVFEDDAVLIPDFSDRFASYIRQVPDDWDMLFFGALHGEAPTRISENVMRITHSLSTYAYALKQTIYDGFIQANRQAPTLLDETTRDLQKRFNCYCFMPHLAWVEDDFSDVRSERTNLWWLKESLVLFGPEIDDILKNTVAIISYSNKHSASLRNLLFTTEYLIQKLPSITLLVLEQGTEQGLNQSDLPPNCHLERVVDSGSAAKSGYERFESSKNFFIFLDSDVFLTREDIRANLLKCRDCDATTSFSEIYSLNEQDTQRILKGDSKWDYDHSYEPDEKTSIYDSGCIVTRRGLCILLEQEKSGHGEDMPLSEAEDLIRIYHSPNSARRLSVR